MNHLPSPQQQPPSARTMTSDAMSLASDQPAELQRMLSISDRERSFLSSGSDGVEGSTATKVRSPTSNTPSDQSTSRRRLNPVTAAGVTEDRREAKDTEDLESQSTPTTVSGAARHTTVSAAAARAESDELASSTAPAGGEEDITGGAMLSDEAKMLAKWKTRSGSHGIRERILKFTPSWFSVTMGTGVIGTLLLLMPWQSTHDGLRYPAIVFVILASLQFVLFAIMFTARYCIWPEVLPLTIKHPQKSMFLGTPVMGLVSIVSGIAQLATREFHLGVRWTLVMTGFWWLTAALSLLTSVGIPWSMMTYQEHFFEGTTAALLLPIVPTITVAAVGSTLCDLLIDYGEGQYDVYAWTMMVVSYMLLGIGLPLALAILVLYLQRLLLFKSPPREIIISCMLPLGPCGQGGEACLHLGQVALRLFPRISTPAAQSGVSQLFDVGQTLYGAGLISSLLLWGLGVWWTLIAMLTIARERLAGKLPFNMGWWSMTFPVASMAICTARIAFALDSLALKIVYTAWVLANVALWITVAVPTAKGFWTGELIQAPCIASLPLKIK